MIALEQKINGINREQQGWLLLNKLISEADLTSEEQFAILSVLGLPPDDQLAHELLKNRGY